MSLRHLIRQMLVGHWKCVWTENVPTIWLWAHDLFRWRWRDLNPRPAASY